MAPTGAPPPRPGGGGPSVLRLRDMVALFAAAVAFFLATQSTSDAELKLAW